MEAYEVLSRHKREGQSFSMVIKEHFGGPRTGADLQRALARVELTDAEIDTLDRQVAERHDGPAPAAIL